MNKRKIAVGPGASSLILIAVVLALSVLTVLTMIAARNDEALTGRSLETRAEVYGLFAAGEKSLAKLDAVLVSCLAETPEDPDAYLSAVKEKLPEGMQMEEDVVSWSEKTDTRSLECAVRILEPGAPERTAWTLHRLEAGENWEDEGFEDFDDFGGFEDEEEAAGDEETFGDEESAGDEEIAADEETAADEEISAEEPESGAEEETAPEKEGEQAE